ncbi:MAG: non-lysosomal glucosylceramidase [Tannerellaceae bacterium]|nr:non-lysosomal glucosylceramidase [Tannerellaceae bacterium]
MKIYQIFTLLLSATFWLTGCEAEAARREATGEHPYNGVCTGEYNSRIAFPVGGMGTGMYCLEGTGFISHMSIRHKPDIYHEPVMFAAIHVKGYENGAKVLEGPVAEWRKFGSPMSGLGGPGGANYGLPRFTNSTFKARFPFGYVSLTDDDIPLDVTITGWSPFIPGDEDNSSLPVGVLEYTFENKSGKPLEAVFSYNSRNFMRAGNGKNSVKPINNGFILSQEGTSTEPHHQGDFAILTDQSNTAVNHCWFRGGWFDGLTMAWNTIVAGDVIKNDPVDHNAPGASLFVPVSLQAGEKKTVKVFTAWYVPFSDQRFGGDPEDPKDNNVPEERLQEELNDKGFYRPWYSSKFKSVKEVGDYLKNNYNDLYGRTQLFTNTFYDTNLPDEVVEAVAANLTILKSPTVLRVYDGRLWNWEGCGDTWGSCHGTCTHVWNYAQTIPHLFPALERSLRHTEFEESQNKAGHQTFRSNLPIRPVEHGFHAAADGQMGGIMKVYRDWRISGDDNFIRNMYSKVKASLDYCIETWDPRHAGIIEEPHHNTYDIEFWGPNGMHNSFYLGALNAFIAMSDYLGQDASLYKQLAAKGKAYTESELYNGEFFIQKIQWEGLRAPDPTKLVSWTVNYSDEAKEVLQKEGPKYQYGIGCLSDGVLGSWIARVAGLEETLDPKKIKSHLCAIHKYNLKEDLSKHANPQCPSFAFGTDGGLLLCSWPNGGKLSLPFVYSDEVWTGIEYQVASHLMMSGEVEKGLDIVRTCRNRYDGRVRNPFNEYECGHWYTRALASYSLLQGLTGVRYDAVEKTLYIDSKIGDFKSFLSTETGFGTVELKNGQPTVSVVSGMIDIKNYKVSGK